MDFPRSVHAAPPPRTRKSKTQETEKAQTLSKSQNICPKHGTRPIAKGDATVYSWNSPCKPLSLMTFVDEVENRNGIGSPRRRNSLDALNSTDQTSGFEASTRSAESSLLPAQPFSTRGGHWFKGLWAESCRHQGVVNVANLDSRRLRRYQRGHVAARSDGRTQRAWIVTGSVQPVCRTRDAYFMDNRCRGSLPWLRCSLTQALPFHRLRSRG